MVFQPQSKDEKESSKAKSRRGRKKKDEASSVDDSASAGEATNQSHSGGIYIKQVSVCTLHEAIQSIVMHSAEYYTLPRIRRSG